MKRKWYEGSKEWGVQVLCALFHVERAHLLTDCLRPKRKTQKGCKVHNVRPCGSKALKKYNRPRWELWRRLYDETT